MSNRVLLNENGLRISKPGFNVLTTGSDNLLFDSTSKMIQVVQSGILTNVSSPVTVNLPSLGFYPFVWAYSPDGGYYFMEYLSTTSVRFTQQTSVIGDIHYLALNVPRNP